MIVQQSVEHQPSNALVLVAAAVVVVGAAYFGIASCGGYVWHKRLFVLLAAGASIIAVIAPSQLLRSNSRKVAFLLVLVGGYVIVESAIAPFYPSTPQSLPEYLSHFLQTLEFGPCG